MLAIDTVRGLTGRPVVQQGTGRFLGRVKDVLIDPQGVQLVALRLTGSGWFNAVRGVAWSQVLGTQLDRLLVDGEPAELAGLAPGAQPLSELIGPPEPVAAGSFVDDAVFDPATGRIVGYQLSRGVLQDLLEGRRFVGIGELLSDPEEAGASTVEGGGLGGDAGMGG